jgi:hypothetical protein
MAESFVDSFKTELIADRVWRTRAQLERAIVAWVGGFNHRWGREAPWVAHRTWTTRERFAAGRAAAWVAHIPTALQLSSIRLNDITTKETNRVSVEPVRLTFCQLRVPPSQLRALAHGTCADVPSVTAWIHQP